MSAYDDEHPQIIPDEDCVRGSNENETDSSSVDDDSDDDVDSESE